MTYAANPAHVDEFMEANPTAQGSYLFDQIDLTDRAATFNLIENTRPHGIIHLAAESHVCRSIEGPEKFFRTNVQSTQNLLDAVLKFQPKARFHHVSTDEVFGDLGLGSSRTFNEWTPYSPRSPYAASKAASDHVVRSYVHTYGLDCVVTHSSNNFGPNQHSEKLIPRTIKSLLAGEEIIVHGVGDHERDWVFVDDHCEAIDRVYHSAKPGSTYCVGGENVRQNLTVINDVLINMRQLIQRDVEAKLKFTEDRPTDDQRYAVDTSAIQKLGWTPSRNYHENLRKTIHWYIENGR
jgi:dTDP-glucose 4,6-dehydratase